METLQAVYGRWARGDFWTPEVFDRDIELVWAPDVPDMDTYHGLAGLEQSIREWFSAWGIIRMEAQEFIEIAADRVLVLVSAHGRGRGSGVEVVTHDYAHAWTMRDGRAMRLVGYASRAAARKAVGLES